MTTRLFRAAALAVAASATLLSTAFAAAPDGTRELHTTPKDAPILRLEVAKAFESLSPKEQRYAHWLSQASWSGNRITFAQVSAESPAILELLTRLFSKDRVALRRAASRLGVTDADFDGLKEYAATFYCNSGNYLSFGASKFVPRIPEEKLALVVKAAGDPKIAALFEKTRKKLYSLEADELIIGLESDGTSAYYSEDVTKAEIDLVKEAMTERKIDPDDTRLFKAKDGTLEIRTASAKAKAPKTFVHKGRKMVVTYGDHAEILKDVVVDFRKAIPFAANDTQKRMLEKYVDFFEGGDIADHKESQRLWVKDLAPAVETNIGFVESYADPAGLRAEWEGFVSVVNAEQTKKFQTLVDAAPKFIPMLPWGAPFEKDRFQRPDFSSLDVLTYAASGIPAGINIPNYDDIRMDVGFKNVSLGNVLAAGNKSKEKRSFIADGDQQLVMDRSSEGFEVQVGLHELLGHGSGKLLTEESAGKFNFDRSVVNPLTGKAVETWYKPGETWGSVFKDLGGAYEECRAEVVGLYLSTEPEVQRIFGHEGAEADDVMYANWLTEARAGADALRYFDPRTKTWGQAHMQARHAILRVMLAAGQGFVTLDKEANGDFVLHMDRTKIRTVGKAAMGDFLKKLGVYKATADYAAGRKMFDELTSVDAKLLEVRDYAIAKRKPRGLWVQAVTDVDAKGNVILREYPTTLDGILDSYQDRWAGLYR